MIPLFALLACTTADAPVEPLLVFAGAASKPPTEEIAQAYEEKTGRKVDVTFGGSGYVLSQMRLAQRGDVYFPGSSDYMEIARREGDVLPETERTVVYLVPAINVQAGNPHGIRSLSDLTRPGLKVAIANPEGVCVGAYAVEIVEKNLSTEQKAAFRANLVNYAESCEKTATAVSLKMADAVLGWSVFQHWDPERIETVALRPEEIVRVGTIPIAISRFTKDRDGAQDFIDFVLGEEGAAIFRKYNYFASSDEAIAWLGAEKPVGGEYVVPGEWLPK